MKIFGFEITRKNTLSHPNSRGGWRRVYDSYPGAWQQGVEVNKEAVLSYSTVFSCMSRISSDVSKLRIKLVSYSSDGEPTEIKKGPLFDLFRRPNAYQNRIQFIWSWANSRCGDGNSYILKERNAADQVVGLHVLDPNLVRVLVSEVGEVFYELQADNLPNIQDAVVIPSRDIIHDRFNTIFHPLVGLSPIYACGLAATQGLSIQQSSSAFFSNGARPGGLLSAPGEIKQDTANRLADYWNSNFTGDNAGRVAVLGDGLKFEALAMTAVDAQLVEQLKMSAETVANCFQIPAFMVGAGPIPPNNNVQSLTTLYYTQCLQSHIEAIELSLQEGLPVPDGIKVEFDLDDLLRMDTATKVSATAEAIGAGFLAPNEARRQHGLGPVAGGDMPYLQQQNFSLEALSRRDAQEDPFGGTGQNSEAEQAAELFEEALS